MIDDTTARIIIIAYGGMCFMAARGFQLRADAGLDHLTPWLWAPAFGLLAIAMGLYALLLRSRTACLVAGIGLHVLVIGRIFASYANDASGTISIPGSTLTATAFYGTILLSSSLVWRYILWPHTRPRR